MPATGTSDQAYRIARIKRRAIPELLNAWESGRVSLKAAYRFSALSPRKQRIALANYLSRRRNNADRQAAWRAKPKRARSLYASASYAETKARRRRRIRRYAIPELVASLERGELSLRAAELLSRLTPRQQRSQLASRLQSQRQKILGEKLAAEAISQILQNRGRRNRLPLSTVVDTIVETIRANLSVPDARKETA
jgi:hypothetical protein